MFGSAFPKRTGHLEDSRRMYSTVKSGKCFHFKIPNVSGHTKKSLGGLMCGIWVDNSRKLRLWVDHRESRLSIGISQGLIKAM